MPIQRQDSESDGPGPPGRRGLAWNGVGTLKAEIVKLGVDASSASVLGTVVDGVGGNRGNRGGAKGLPKGTERVTLTAPGGDTAQGMRRIVPGSGWTPVSSQRTRDRS